MSAEAWQQGHARALAVFLSGDGLNDVDGRGRAVVDDSFVLFFNAAAEGVIFQLPRSLHLDGGEVLIDTSKTTDNALPGTQFESAEHFVLAGRSLALIRFPRRQTE
jgi:glycogen operon protein